MDERDEAGRREVGHPPDSLDAGASAAQLLREIQEGIVPDRRSRGRERRKSERRQRRMRSPALAVAAAAAVLLALSVYWAGRGSDSDLEYPPDELLGTWSTDEPRYAGRTISITEDRLTLNLGADGRFSYAIEAIQIDVAEVHRMYTVHYTDEGGEQTIQLFVYDDGLLRLLNPSEVRWTRQSDGGAQP